MRKDKEGKFHSAKGKPSGANKEEGLGLRKSLPPEELERDLEMTDRYTTGSDRLSDDLHVRHRNRNTSKNEITKTESQAYKSKLAAFTDDVTNTEAEELVPFIPKELFTYLSTYRSAICLSILLPTHPAGVEVNEQVDLIAYKTALQDAEKILADRSIDNGIIKRILKPGYDLLRDEALWYNMSGGLAVYMADGFMKFIRLPGAVKKEVAVNNSFSVMQLIPFMVRKEYYHILVISKKNAQFYRADAFGIEHIPVDELPNAIDDVVHFENKDDQKLFRLSGSGSKSANYHGMGAGKPDEKQNIALYLEEVDHTLWETHLRYSHAPLLLAGVEYLIPIYKAVSGYKHIWPDALTGNHQYDDPQSLYEQSMKVIQPYFDKNLKNALEEFGNKSATPLSSTQYKEIIPAAFYGRIASLFVEKDARLWGTFDEVANELKMLSGQKENAENLADKAVAKTIENGGSVFILNKIDMPGTGSLAAIFRY